MTALTMKLNRSCLHVLFLHDDSVISDALMSDGDRHLSESDVCTLQQTSSFLPAMHHICRPQAEYPTAKTRVSGIKPATIRSICMYRSLRLLLTYHASRVETMPQKEITPREVCVEGVSGLPEARKQALEAFCYPPVPETQLVYGTVL